MRLAVLGFRHEANTFASSRATMDKWQAGTLVGEAILQRHATAQSIVAGFCAYAAETPEVELTPLVFAEVTPTGTTPADAFEHLCGQMIDALRAQGPWDGVLVAQHGAAVAEHHRDADGEFVRRIRATVGPGVPVGVTVDMHANVSEQMVEHADVITVYQTNPHVDARDQGLSCARLIGRTVRGEVDPVAALRRLPLAVNILRQGTGEEPMASLVELAEKHQARPGVLSVSVVTGFPYADVEHMGMSVVAITDQDEVLAAEIVSDLADAAWNRRADMAGTAPSPEDALRRAAAEPDGPVVVMDMGDNVGGGGPGDSTHLMHAARRVGVSRLAMSLHDADAVQTCLGAGVGARVELRVGGKTDDRHGDPIPVTGEVLAISDGTFEDPTPTHGGARFFDLGPSAGVRTDDGWYLAVHTRPAGTMSQQQFRAVAIEPTQMKIIAAKGVHSPRAAFEPIATRLIFADTPGATAADVSTLDYQHRQRPMYPFEPCDET